MINDKLRQKLDKMFNTFFVKDERSRASLVVIAQRLGIDEDEAFEYLNIKKLPLKSKNDILYLEGYRFNDNLRTPAIKEDSKQELFKLDELIKENKNLSRDIKPSKLDEQKEIEILKQNKDIFEIQLEEYKRKLKEKDRLLKEQREEIRRQAREKLELEEKHINELREHIEKVNLGHSLNSDIPKTLERISKQLETLSNRDIKILLLVDSIERDGKRHSRKVFIPKEQKYTFEIGHEYKHENPDLKIHYS